MWLLFLAFGHKFPAELIDPYNNPYEGCPVKTHFSAVGIADSIKGSIARAHMDISSQVYSSLQSETTMQNTVSALGVQNGSKKSSIIKSEKNIDSKLQVKTSLEFNHLITDEMRGVLHPKNTNYYTLSCLDKSTLFEHIYTSIEAPLIRFQSLSTSALDEYNSDNLYDFSKELYEIKPLSDAQLANMEILDSLRSEASFVPNYTQQIERLKRAQEEALKSTKIVVSFDDTFSDAQIDGMTRALTNQFQSSTLDVRVGDVRVGKGCRNSATHSIFIQKTMNCDYGNMGYVCKAQLPSTIVDCSSSAEKSFVITGFSSKSTTDSDGVEAAVEKKIAGRKFGVAFEGALNNFVPYRSWPD